MNFDKVEHYLDYVAELMNEWNIEFTEEIEAELAELWHEIHNGYEDALAKWIREDLPILISHVINMIFFGCSEDGHFTVYIPESWNQVTFNYGADYSNKNTYGRLILEMYITDTFQYNGTPTDLVWEVQ